MAHLADTVVEHVGDVHITHCAHGYTIGIIQLCCSGGPPIPSDTPATRARDGDDDTRRAHLRDHDKYRSEAMVTGRNLMASNMAVRRW